MKITIVNFSGRVDGGNGAFISSFITKTLNNTHSINEIKLSQLNMNGCNQCHYQCFNGKCQYEDDDIKYVYERIATSDLCLYIIPNHSGWPASNYFTFNERSQSVFNDVNFEDYIKTEKQFIVLSNTDASLIKEVLKRDFQQIQEEDITVIRSRDYGESSISGNLSRHHDFEGYLIAYINRFKERFAI